MAKKRAPHKNVHRRHNETMTPVVVKCPTCGEERTEYYDRVPPEKVPRRYCSKHNHNRHASEFGYDWDDVAA